MSRSNLESGGTFIRKPARGWLHSDMLISKEGVTYTLRVRIFLWLIKFHVITRRVLQYVGCLEVHSSMKSLDFETRSQVAR